MDNHPISSFHLGQYFQVDGKHLQLQYKEHISDYHQWEQKQHAGEWMLYEENLSPYLSIDETALSNGELYTIVTNKEAKGRKGSISPCSRVHRRIRLLRCYTVFRST